MLKVKKASVKKDSKQKKIKIRILKKDAKLFNEVRKLQELAKKELKALPILKKDEGEKSA